MTNKEVFACNNLNEFLEKYDRLNSGMPIGGFVETAIFVDMIQKIKEEREKK